MPHRNADRIALGLEPKLPVVSREIPNTAQVPWASTGWTNDRNVTQMLELLMARGEVAIAGRVGRERLRDVPERVYPVVEVPSVEEAERRRNERRLSALGIARAKTTKVPVEPWDVGEAGEPAVVAAGQRRWGFFALPILHGDRLVGKLDAIADRKAGVLRVNAIHEGVKFTRAIAKAVEAELDGLAAWLELAVGYG